MSELDTTESTRPDTPPSPRLPDAAEPVGEPKEAPEPRRAESPTRSGPDDTEEPEAPESADDAAEPDEPEGSAEPLEPEASAERDKDTDTGAADARPDDEAEPEEPEEPESPETEDEDKDETEADADAERPDEPEAPETLAPDDGEAEPEEPEAPEHPENSEEPEAEEEPDDSEQDPADPEREDVEEGDEPDAPTEGEDPDASAASGRPEAPDDEDVPELELELKPRREVPYSAAYVASLSAGKLDEASRKAPEVPHVERRVSPSSDNAADADEQADHDTLQEAQASDSSAEIEPEPDEAADDSATDDNTELQESDAPEELAEPESGDGADEAVAPVEAQQAAPTNGLIDEAGRVPVEELEPQAGDARNLGAHADSKAKSVEALEAKTPRSEAEAAGLAGSGAVAGETLRPSDGSGISQDHEPKAESKAEAAEGEAEQYDNSALRDGPGYQKEIDDQLGARGLDRSEHDKLRLTRTNELSEPQAREVVGVRDAIRLDEGRMVTKVITPETMEAYLGNATKLGPYSFNPGEFRGSIARGSDTADLRSMDQLRDGLALDDGGAGWTPVPRGASEAYQLRFPAPHDMRADPTLGAVGDKPLADHVAGMAGQSEGRAWDDPFLGTGYTGGGVPEWYAEPTSLPHHAEIWRMHSDGTEEAVGFFDKNEGLWNEYD